MAKVLVTAHLGRHFRIFGHYDYQVLLEMGHEVHIAANFYDPIDHFDDARVVKHQIDFNRNPIQKDNLKALKQLELLFKEIHFDLIHCQSPSGGVITRLAARNTRKKGTKVAYTAHGLHFFRGAPLKNWILYFSIERVLGLYTDLIITMNNEDYLNAKHKLKIKNVEFIHGVGIDTTKFLSQTTLKKNELRRVLGYTSDNFILICVGELSYRKHQDLIISALGKLKDKIPNIKLLLVGTGGMSNEYRELVERLNIINHVEFLGYRNDIKDLMMISDVAVSTSRQEGLPLNVMEAMATALPLIVTDCRGNRDLITDNKNGFVVPVDNIDKVVEAVNNLYLFDELRQKYGSVNETIISAYALENVQCEMKIIYTKVLAN